MDNDIITYHRYHDCYTRSYNGVDQVPISAKIDTGNMAAMEAEMAATGVKRNRLINLAVKWYLRKLDERRREVCEGVQLQKYILKLDLNNLTTEELEKLDHISRGFGCTTEQFAQHALSVALMDYDKNPYRYMP